MTTRRTFIKNTSLASAGILTNSSFLKFDRKYTGLQLYTVRDAMQVDAAGTLAKVAALGFNSVEGATYTGTQKFYGMTPTAFSVLLKQHDLVMPSAHYRLGEEKLQDKIVRGTILHDWDQAVEDAAAVGIKYMVCAYLAEEERMGADRYKNLADQFNKAAEICRKANIQFCYHNHDFEFVEQDGKLPYTLLLENTDEELVKTELDLYWIYKAGHDPIELFNKYPKRFPLWHVKDMDTTPEKNFTEVGNGSIDFKKLFKKAKKAGLEYYFVEQDQTPGSPFDSIKTSIDYIRKNKLV